MLTCEHCRDRLLDHAYNVLDGAELEETLGHLETCADCRAALAKVRTQQKQMARAALAISQIPEFRLPNDAPTLPAAPAPVQQPETVAFVQEAPKKPSAWRRPWIAWVLAASILVAVGLPLLWYRNTVQGYQTDIAKVRHELRGVELELASLWAEKFEKPQADAIRAAHKNAVPYLHVVGPKTLQPKARAHLEITTRHPEGDLLACNLRIKLSDETGQVIKIDRPTSEGHVRVPLDARSVKPNQQVNLLIEAETPHGLSRVQETVQVLAPTYVVRIDTNKSLYEPRDVLFCRVLVLDRVTLQPPAQPVEVRISLTHNNKPVRTQERITGAGGIIAVEFAIEEGFSDGLYALEATAGDAKQAGLQPASVPLQIIRELPAIRLDHNSYARGDMISGDIVVPGYAPLPPKILGRLDSRDVPINVQPQPSAPGGGAGGYGKAANAKSAPDGLAYRFNATIPPDVAKDANQLRLTVPVPNNAAKPALDAIIPLDPVVYAIDFFPEGGDLIAGVQNRVFYRVRSKNGAPILKDGSVIVLSSKNQVVDSSYQLGMGYFDFTPDPKEQYSVRVTKPDGTFENLPAPFAALGGVRLAGVAMQVADTCDDHAPHAVGKQGEPIHMTLRRAGPGGKILLVAHCRGQIVDQRWIDLHKDPVDVTLQPAPDAQGMMRVTAYEPAGAELSPIAERLVYRAPAQRLDIGFHAERAMPGNATKAKLTATDEAGKPAPGWILASIVDERFQNRPRSLDAHFLVMNEMRSGPQLEYAQVMLNDAPESARMLERFLGTHGWRRYVAAQPADIAPAAHGGAASVVFSKENRSLEALQKSYQDGLDQVLTPIRKRVLEEQAKLQVERERLSAAVNIATGLLHNFESQTQTWLRLGMGLMLAALLAGGIGCMGVGAYRAIRAHRSATRAFASAFACLCLCLGIVFAGSFLGPLPDQEFPKGRMEEPVAMNKNGIPQPEKQAHADEPRPRVPVGNVFTGAFALREQTTARPVAQAAMNADQKTHEEKLKQEAARALSTDVLLRASRADRGEVANSLTRRMQTIENETLQEWFNKAAGGPAPMPFPAAKGTEAKKKDAKLPLRELEYPFKQSANAVGDTILWHPNLFLADGASEVRFAVPPAQGTTYRVLLLGHDASGRFGYFETRLDVPGYGAR